MFMHEFERKLGPQVLRLRWLILIVTLGVIGFCATGLGKLTFTQSYRVFFGPDNPQLLAFDLVEKTYSKNDNLLIVFEPNNGDVFTRDTLSVIERITEEAWQIPYSRRVDSISNFQHTYSEDDDLIVGDLVSGAENLSDDELRKIAQIAVNEPLLRHRLISTDGKATAVNVTIQLPGLNPQAESPEVVRHVRTLVAEFQANHPNISIYVTGVVMLNNAFSESALYDLGTLMPLSFGVMLLFLYLVLRSISAVVSTTLVIVFSIVAAMGIGGHLGLAITPVSTAAPQMILTLAIANSVHMLLTMITGLRQGESISDALIESLRLNIQPIFLTSATTILGFLSMNFSEVPPFKDLGNLVAIGVAVSFVLSVTFLPSLMSFLPVRFKSVQDGPNQSMSILADFVIRRRNILLIVMGALTLGSVAFIPANALSDQFIKYFHESTEFRQNTDGATRHLAGMYQLDYSIPAADSGGISDPAYMALVDEFAQWLRQQDEVTHVNVYTDTMKRLNKNMHGDDSSYYRLPDGRELAAQYLLLYELSLPYGLDLNDQINVDKSATRLIVSAKRLPSVYFLALEKKVQDWQAEHFPEYMRSEGTGPIMMFSKISKRNIESLLFGSVLALMGISFLLILALKSVKVGLLSLIPNLVPAGIGFGLWGLFVGEINMGLSVVVGMTLGIVVDDTVHFLSKYLRARREKGYAADEAVRYAFGQVGKALWSTSVVLIAGFGVLMFSNFVINSSMAILTAMIIVAALLADFLLLPALLLKLEKQK